MDPEQRVTPGGIEVAGWLLKARRDVWDVVGAIAQAEPITSWRLTANYRVEWIRVGDPVVLWLTGAASDRPEPGIWAVGSVTGEVDEGSGSDEGWIDLEARDIVRPRVPVDLVVLRHPLTRVELAEHPGFARAEILVAPRVGNPGVLRADELAAVASLLDDAGEATAAVIDRWNAA